MVYLMLLSLFALYCSTNANERKIDELFNLAQRQQETIEEQRKYIDLLLEHSNTKTSKDDCHGTKKENKRLLLDDPSHLQVEIDQLKSSISSLKSTVASATSNKGGAVYTRWGKKVCPTNGTELVYSGYVGGSHYTHPGGAAEYICLPTDPVFGKDIFTNNDQGYIYGAEYETTYFGQIQDEDVPCAVCRSRTGTSSIMMAGKDQCYTGWKQEYNGRLASGYYNHAAASQYVCVDGNPDVLAAGDANANGKLFYGVKAACGSLKCPPYHEGKEFLCVVCSK